jgi:cytochrome c
MREMFLESEKMQQAIKADKIPVDLRTKFATMQTLTPTDPEMITEPFGTMAKAFLKSMDKIYEEKNQVQDYNVMVQSCLACHQNQCPGPMVRIKKLLIE